MTTVPQQRTEYRIDDLARAAGTTVRNVRAYQDRGLLPPAVRRGRANVYRQEHLDRLHMVAQLLDRGHTLAGIKELLDAWDSGRGLGGVLGLVSEVTAPWTDEEPVRLTRAALVASFHGVEDEQAIAAAVRLGVLQPEEPDSFVVPSPGLLAVAMELHELGVPLAAIVAHLEELRGDIDHLARRFVEFSAVHIFVRYAGHQLTDEEAAEAVGTVRRLRPLAQSVVDAELARAMRSEATRLLDAAVAGPLRELVGKELGGRESAVREPAVRESGGPARQGLTET
ncbi:MerR family transcriptional regulator [Streptacidiphilus sp. PB12-B1b]|uniref:MerR family transcriptional regulator n=1 Tax=Streptacidiphilus sp. PB12-B1b TaxID=2705012 RepID=UPI0015FDE7A9|nr:MerR family transcriptional regulator [Streptacidiphilus sp. PB12-B1b]